MTEQTKSFIDQLPIKVMFACGDFIIYDDCYESLPCMHTVKICDCITLLDAQQILYQLETRKLTVPKEINQHFANDIDDADLGISLFG